MAVTLIAGAQWGDEGKGKITDYLAQSSDMVIRCQGGPNAGHTIVNSQGVFALHALPSGVFHPDVLNVLGPGVVIDTIQLAREIAGLADAGVSIERLLISDRAHLILPYHVALDRLDDALRPGNLRIGSTGCGIAPAYADKAARIGIRMGDTRSDARLRERIAVALDRHNLMLRTHFGHPGFTVDEILNAVAPSIERLRRYIGDTSTIVHAALVRNDRILLEGQLGVMRDVDWGSYPFVTSSSPTPAGLAAAAGIPPQAVTRSIGVMKAYTTSVGDGPFPTELLGVDGEDLREVGSEYGATTGRPRRCGWLDLPAARWACDLAGFDEIALTKLDILDGLEAIPVCIDYQVDGQSISASDAAFDWSGITPLYRAFPGWNSCTQAIREFENMPPEARAYVDYCSEYLAKPTTLIGVGRPRDGIIDRSFSH